MPIPEFRKQEADHQVRAFQPSPLHFDHAQAGLLRLEAVEFAADDGWQNLTTFLAADEETLLRLRRL